jgi:DnaJ-class molecular chaperone
MQTLYEALGIPKTAKPEQIKRAYRILVKRFHPDLFPSGSNAQFAAEVRIREINAAYGVLSHPQKRSAYDATITKQKRSHDAEPTPEYCKKCGKPTLYWQIDRDVPLCNDCGKSALSRY